MSLRTIQAASGTPMELEDRVASLEHQVLGHNGLATGHLVGIAQGVDAA